MDSIDAIEIYLANIGEDEFYRNDQKRDAVLMRLIVIGEYGSKVSEKIKNEFKEIEWQTIQAARNFYVHVYDKVNWRHVWDTVHVDLPPLKIKIEKILSQIDKNI